jgi:hypothetical protein
MKTGVGLVLLATVLLSRAINAEDMPIPGGWFLDAEPSVHHFRIGLDRETKHEGKYSGILESTAAALKQNHYARLVQSIEAAKYHGKRLRLAAFLKTQDVKESARLSVIAPYLYEDLDAASYQEPPLQGSTEWKRYAIEFTVPAANVVKEIQIRVNLIGPGKVWVDDVSLEIVGAANESSPPAAREQPAAPPVFFDELANTRFEQTQGEYNLGLLQGKWEIKHPDAGKDKLTSNIAREVLEVQGNKLTITSYLTTGEVWQELTYPFELERSGRISMITLGYENIKGRADSHPYTVNRSQFIEVFQLLDGQPGPPFLRHWNRVVK